MPCLCLQGRPLQRPHPRRLPKNRGRHAEERSGHEGELRWGWGRARSPARIPGAVGSACCKPFHEQAVFGMTIRACHKVGLNLLAFLDHFILEHNGKSSHFGGRSTCIQKLCVINKTMGIFSKQIIQNCVVLAGEVQ